MRLLRECEVKEKEYFMSPTTFLDAEIEVPKEFAYENVMIKGSTGTGKTSKVLIPLFKQFEYGKLYMNISNSYGEKIINDDIIAIDLRDNANLYTAEEIVSSLIKGEAVYINLDVANHSKEATELVNAIFKNLIERKKELFSPVLICIDDIAYSVRIDNLLDYLVSSSEGRKKDLNKNFYLACTLCYTRQLVELYTEEEIEKIKEHVTMIDVEKQPIQYEYY